jgi:hypothetical protein
MISGLGKSFPNVLVVGELITNTLKGRYNEFSGRHTAMYPIWVLLYFGWKLEFGWKESDEPSLEEKRLKEKYQNTHQNRLPALVKR